MHFTLLEYLENNSGKSISTMESITKPNFNLCEMQKKNDLEQFEDFFPKLLLKLETESDGNTLSKKSLEWVIKVIVNNVPHGKKLRALLLLELFRELNPQSSQAEDEQCFVVGWCIEILQASCLIADDIMDNSETRRGKLCWYKMPEIGLNAINDVLLLENTVYQLLNIYFQKSPRILLQLTQLFNRTTFITALGQHLDTQKLNLDNFTEKNYSDIVKGKTSYYTFCLPVKGALILSRLFDNLCMDSIEQICFNIGYLFQVQDDYIDCFVDPSVSQKIGTDIQDGKCTWFAVQVLKFVTEKERSLFWDSYGKNDESSVSFIKSLYNEFNLEILYWKFEQLTYMMTLDSIKNAFKQNKLFPFKSFITILNRIYGRNK